MRRAPAFVACCTLVSVGVGLTVAWAQGRGYPEQPAGGAPSAPSVVSSSAAGADRFAQTPPHELLQLGTRLYQERRYQEASEVLHSAARRREQLSPSHQQYLDQMLAVLERSMSGAAASSPPSSRSASVPADLLEPIGPVPSARPLPPISGERSATVATLPPAPLRTGMPATAPPMPSPAVRAGGMHPYPMAAGAAGDPSVVPTGGANDPSLRTRAMLLVQRARAAANVGDYGLAEDLARQAESLNVTYPPNVDTPARILQEIAERRQNPDRGPALDAETESNALLLQARAATAAGAFDQAEVLIAQAEQRGATYGFFEGNAVEEARMELADARAAAESSVGAGLPPAVPNSGDRAVATAYVRAAREAAMQGNVHRAYILAHHARSIAATFGPGEDSPQALLRDLDAMMRQQGPTQVAGSPGGPVGGPAPSFPDPTDISGAVERAQAASRERREQPERLLAEARHAFNLGDLGQARVLASQAMNSGHSWNPVGDTPQQLLAEIHQYEAAEQAFRRDSNSPAARRNWHNFLLQHAERLTNEGYHDQAEALADYAESLGVEPQPLVDPSPDAVRSRIAENRRGAPRVEVRPSPVGGSTSPPTAGSGTGSAGPTSSASPRPFPGTGSAATSPPHPAGPTGVSPAAGTSQSETQRQQAAFLLDRAASLLAQGRYDEAERLAREAQNMGVAPAGGQMTAEAMLERIAAARRAVGAGPSGQGVPAGGSASPPNGTGGSSGANPSVQRAAGQPSVHELYQAAIQAWQRQDRDAARHYFDQVREHPDFGQLDARSRQQMQDILISLGPPGVRQAGAGPQDSGGSGSQGQGLVPQAQERLRIQLNELHSQAIEAIAEAEQLRATDPEAALAGLREALARVEASGIEPRYTEAVLNSLNRAIADTESFAQMNAANLAQDQRNQQIMDELDRERQWRVEVDNELAHLVDEFNTLIDQRRFAEAELAAERAREIDPTNPVVETMVWKARFAREIARSLDIEEGQQQWFLDSLADAETFPPSEALYGPVYPVNFSEMSARRLQQYGRPGADRPSEEELRIQESLSTRVSLHFEDEPLANVIAYLADMTGANIVLDPEGLRDEAVPTDTPITIDVDGIMLRSALSLILEPLHLEAVPRNEVLMITSQMRARGELKTITYPVGDLIIPIPNFLNSGSMGLTGALGGPYGGDPRQFVGTGPVIMASNDAAQQPTTNLDGTPAHGVMTTNAPILAQNPYGPSGGTPGFDVSGGLNGAGGPMGMGGGAFVDFDSLINLITQTVEPESWQDVGGAGSIEPFPTTLSLIIRQTQAVHEEIADLLTQLRRLNDLQVTIEVRFITVSDNFFERIGIDFDFDIQDHIDRQNPQPFGQIDPTFEPEFTIPGQPIGDEDGASTLFENQPRDLQERDRYRPQTIVGLQTPEAFSADFDIPFRQGSFPVGVPQFGGFNPGVGASLGLAILSDIEAFLFIEAAQGDDRSNVMVAPKVTLFNGQTAFVTQSSQRPFVISLIPVVGQFAAGFQPQIVVLDEAISLQVRAVISADRRYVRLTLVPFFSTIGDVETFSFATGDFAGGAAGLGGLGGQGGLFGGLGGGGGGGGEDQAASALTVQLPEFNFTTVTTTVSVPDGGTILLGGIKQLAEGRTMSGVPILNKLPYINRLFKNSGVGRETSSVMLMVTPRIIIQEEEEQLLLGTTPP